MAGLSVQRPRTMKRHLHHYLTGTVEVASHVSPTLTSTTFGRPTQTEGRGVEWSTH